MKKKRDSLNELAKVNKEKKPLTIKSRRSQNLGHDENNFSEDVEERAKEAMEELEVSYQTQIDFPFHVFPENLTNILKVFYESSGFNAEYYFSNLISVSALCISNKYRIKAKNDFIQPAIFYMVNMGKSGLGKSAPQKSIWTPIFRIQKKKIEKWKLDLKEWQEERNEAIENKDKSFDRPEPMLHKIIFEYATVEALWEIITYCQHGFALVDDEIGGWVEGMGQYSNSKGPEIAYWLKNYDNPGIVIIDRKGQPSKYIYNSAVNINGNIQPKIIKKLADGDKGENGFFARFLITIPGHEKVSLWNEEQPDFSVYEKYDKIIKFLYNLPSHLPNEIPHATRDYERIDFPLSAKAKKLYVEFYNSLAYRMNEETDDKKFSQLSKYRGICLRFALVMEMMHFAADNYENKDWSEAVAYNERLAKMEKHSISEKAMKAAIELTSYYIDTAMTVLSQFESVINTYKKEVRVWYKQLPESFKSKFAVELGEKVGVGGRSTVYNLLNDKNLFKKNNLDNHYWKIIES